MRVAWRRDDPAIEADAIEFWTRHGLLPEGVDPAARAKELIAAAYKDGRLAAVATATIGRIDFLRARFAIIRGATDARIPAQPRPAVALGAGPRGDARLGARTSRGEISPAPSSSSTAANGAISPGCRSGRNRSSKLVGYDQHGRQIRVRWFEDFRYDEPAPRARRCPRRAAGPAARASSCAPAWRRGRCRDRGAMRSPSGGGSAICPPT